jgi:hypothetical protein
MDADRTEATRGLFDLLEGPALARLERETVARGTRLIAAGSSAEEIYLVETGRFTVERDGVSLAEIGAGSVIGEIAFLTGGTRTADVIAARNSVVLRIDRRAYDLLCATTTGAAAGHRGGTRRSPGRDLRPGRSRSRPPPGADDLPFALGRRTPALAFAPDLAREMAVAGDVRLITEADFRRAVGENADPEGADALAWLNAQERTADTVLFVAGAEADAWSRAVLHQADHAVFVAQALRQAPPSPLEDLALDLIPQTQRRLVLIHPAPDAAGARHGALAGDTARLPAPPRRPDRRWRGYRAACAVPDRARHRDGAVGRRGFRGRPCRRLAGDPRSRHPAGHRRRDLGGFRHGRRDRARRSGRRDRARGSRRSSSVPVPCGV